MATPPTSQKFMQEAVGAVSRYGNETKAAAALGIARSTLQGRLRAAALHGVNADTPPTKPEAPLEDQLRDRVAELESQLRTHRANTLTDEYVKRKIIGLDEQVDAVKPPRWMIEPKRGKALPGVPVAIWSDWHWGEVVDLNEMGGVNEFNLEIAHERAKLLVQRTAYLLCEHVVRPEYPGIVINLGGDMLSGDIHDELTATNDIAVLPALLDLFGVLCAALASMADTFGNVFVPCVSGNHGRLTKKPRAKQRNFTNLDWLLYRFLQKHFEAKGDHRVQFFIPDAPDASYNVWGFTYLLTHGDQFKGGDGMIGHIGPVMRGSKKKLSRQASVGRTFDLMMHGHFHTWSPGSRIIGNGSLKGYCEYAANILNVDYEPAQQALWLCHPEHGVTTHMPIYLQPHAKAAEGGEWASWETQKKTWRKLSTANK